MGAAKNYFKDFDVQETIDEKGHRKKLLIYKGNTWTMTIAEEKVLPRKIIFLVLALIMVGTGIAGNTLNVAGNRSGVPAATGLVAFIPMFLVVYSCIYSLILKSTTLQRAQYRETSIFMKVGAAAATVLALTAAVGHIIVASMGTFPEELGNEIFAAVLWFISAMASLALFIWEMKTEYVQKRNDGTIVYKEHFRRGSETY